MILFEYFCAELLNQKDMKNLLFILMSCFFISTHAMAQTPGGDPIDLNLGWIDPTPVGDGPARTPVDSPTVYLNDHTLTFATSHSEYVLYIKDENETVVYSTVVTSATKEVVLPSTLSGDYEIQLVTGNWCFWGYIEL